MPLSGGRYFAHYLGWRRHSIIFADDFALHGLFWHGPGIGTTITRGPVSSRPQRFDDCGTWVCINGIIIFGGVISERIVSFQSCNANYFARFPIPTAFTPCAALGAASPVPASCRGQSITFTRMAAASNLRGWSTGTPDGSRRSTRIPAYVVYHGAGTRSSNSRAKQSLWANCAM